MGHFILNEYLGLHKLSTGRFASVYYKIWQHDNGSTETYFSLYSDNPHRINGTTVYMQDFEQTMLDRPHIDIPAEM